MKRKLKCVIVDDDPEAHQIILQQLKNSLTGEITHSFYRPSDLVGIISEIDFDAVFLDIVFTNDTLQGFDIASRLIAQNKVVIFISGNNQFIIEACKYVGAIDVVPKPNTKEKLNDALEKAWKVKFSIIESDKKEHELFFVAERKEQISLLLSDILYVKTAIGDHRNKEVILKGGEKFTLMDCTFGNLLQMSSKLVRINTSELVSYDIVNSLFHDTINVKPNVPQGIAKTLTLSKTYRKAFKTNIV
ncbi:MAG TPA: response regulator [Bacteroidia bacterium]|jgi:DNA-binding LytR/AlgR family response regulator|nr:response regulator [Bacteroidia bacterium]